MSNDLNRGGSSKNPELQSEAQKVVVVESDLPHGDGSVSGVESKVVLESDLPHGDGSVSGVESGCVKMFGVVCDESFANGVCERLRDLRVDATIGKSFLDILPSLPAKHVIDIPAEIDKKYGSGVASCLHLLGVKLTPVLVCGCGKLGHRALLESTHMLCARYNAGCVCKDAIEHQDLNPWDLARTVARILDRPSIGVDYQFMQMLGALAGYPFACACGNPVTYLDAPYTCCDFCVGKDGSSSFIRHMFSTSQMASTLATGAVEGVTSAFRAAGSAIKDTGAKIYSLITELVTTVGNYFNSLFQGWGGEFYKGMQDGFVETVRGVATKLKDALGSDGFLFLFVAIVVAVLIKHTANFVANFIISSSLALFEMMKTFPETLKHAGDDLFSGFIRIYESILSHFRSGGDASEDGAPGEGEFILHAAGSDGCTAMIATLFCTIISATSPLSTTHLLRAISSARGVVAGLKVARSGLLWLIETLPLSLQAFLWDMTGIGSFDCDDQMKQVIVVMRESILSLRKNPSAFLNDVQLCKILLTSHTMLTRDVTLNKHGWNATQISILRAMLTETKDHIARAQACVDRGSGRPEPVGLILEGPPGIGKTALIEVLAAKLNPDIPRAARVYYKNIGEKFWSGYSEHPVVVIDDYGAVKNDDREAQLAADLLRIISPGEMALDTPFADKGAVFCKSNLVVLTTNRNMNSPQKFLESNKAFMRRFLYCTMTLKDEFKDPNGLLNTAKLRNLPLADSSNFPHVNFRLHTKFSSRSEAAGLYDLSTRDRTFSELITVLEALIVKKADDAQLLHTLAEEVQPTPAESKEYKEFKKEANRIVEDAESADVVREVFITHMLATPRQDEMKPASLASSSRDSTNDQKLDDGYGLEWPSSDEKSAMIEHSTEQYLNTVVYRPSPFKPLRTSGGNKLGPKARRRVAEAKSNPSQARDTCNPSEFYAFQDEFTGGALVDDDLAIRAGMFLSERATTVYVRPSSLKDYTERFKKAMVSGALEVMQLIAGHPFKVLAAITATATTVAMCLNAFKFFTESSHESHMATKYSANHEKRRPNVLARPRYQPIVRHNQDTATDEGVIRKIAENCGYIERAGAKVGCFFVQGNVFRTVTHFFRTSATSDRWIPDGTPFTLTVRGDGDKLTEYKMSFSWDFILPCENEQGLLSDWLYYSCGSKVPPKKNMTDFHIPAKKFVHRAEFRDIKMVRFDGVSKGIVGTVRNLPHAFLQYSSVDGSKKPDVYLPISILSDYQCSHGDCGFPVIGKVDGQYKILSIHVGIRSRPLSSESTSAVVTIDEVHECLAELDRKHYPITKHCAVSDVVPCEPRVKLNDSYTHLGKLTWAPPGVSSKTKYVRSLIYNHLEKDVIYEPSIMGDPTDARTSLGPFDVLAQIANRADASLAVMPEKWVKLAGDALFESVTSVIPVCEETHIRVLTLKEALNGDGRLVDRYPTAGSPGLPSTLSRKHGVKGKHGIMQQNADGDWFISDPDCAQRVATLHNAFSDGVVPFYVNQLCMKDETLKCNEDGVVKKTRGIKCAPIEANLCGKMYFGAMVGLFKKHFDRIPFKCGMNVFSSDWDDFIKWHREIGYKAFDGDIGGQENIIKGEIYDELYRFTNRIYAYYGETPTDEEKRQRASYLASLCHYYFVLGSDLFRAKFGNPSGNWLTAFICSFCSGILLGVAYFGLAEQYDPLKANVYCFLHFVRMSLAGDDNFVTRASCIDWFSGANVSKFLFDNFGYKYTDAKKAAVFPPDRDVTECSFLACTTRLTDEYAGIMYMACIDEGPLDKCVQYVSNKAADGDPRIAIIDNANTAISLAWTSGKERFERYRERYARAFQNTPNFRQPILLDYSFCEQRFLAKELLSEDYTSDDYSFIPQMLKSPELTNAEFDKAQVRVEAGSEKKPDAQVTYKPTESTVLEPAKRFTLMYYSPPVTSGASYTESVSAAYITRTSVSTDLRPMAGTLAWFAGPFAAWSGDLRLAIKCNGDLLIRTDATERLANSAVVPKVIANGISAMCPFDSTSMKGDWAMLQFPSTIPYKFNILPKLEGEEKYRQTTSASFVIDTPVDSRPALSIYAAAGDNYSTHFLFFVPSIRVSGSYYPHNRNYDITLPEYLTLKNIVGAPAFPFSQSSVIQNYKEQSVVVSDGLLIKSVNYRTELFTDAQLVSLGVVTVAPVNRRYDPGAVKEVACDMKNCTARSLEIEVRPGGPTTGAGNFNIDPKSAVVRGTAYLVGTTEMASGWYLTYLSYANATVRGALNGTGIPTTEIVIPTAQSGYEHSLAVSFITPRTNSAAAYLGGSYFVWDTTPGYAKAFYDTQIFPFKSDLDLKEEYAFVKHMDSGDHGIGFTNVNDAPVVPTDRKPRVARKQMGEEKYTFNSFVDRYQLLRSFQWDDSQVQGTILDTRSVPYQCIGSTSETPFQKFCYWNGDVEIKVQVQSTGFVCGKLIVVLAPFCDPARASYLQLPSLVSMSVAPNVTIMAGNTTEVTMLIPYAHYKNYLNTDGETGDPFALLGTVSIVVFNKLRVAAGSVNYCTVNVYSRFRNSDFQMLRPPPAEGYVSFIRHGATMSIAKNVSGVLNDVTDAVSRVGAVAEYGLDAPNVGANYTPVFQRAAPMLNHSTNVHYMNVMDMHPGQQSLVDAKDVASTIPECTLSYLLKKQSFLNSFTIKESDIEGEVYMVLPLTPTMKLFNAPLNSMVDETLMGYIAAPFKFWRGGFKIIIEVIATSVHTLRLVVATHYGGASSTVGMENILAQNAEVLEVGAGQNTFEVVIPWRAPTQWLEVPAGPPEPSNPFEVTSSARFSMGEVSIRLLTRLQTMPSVSPEIDCNVYVSMLDDAQLAYIGMNTADLTPVFTANQKLVPASLVERKEG